MAVSAASGCVFSPQATITRTAVPSARCSGRAGGGQLTLGQNYPNPYNNETTVPFTLSDPADVRLSLFDLLGRKVAGVVRRQLAPGEQSIVLNLQGLGLPPGDYVYRLQVLTPYGVFGLSRLMTAV